MSPVDEDAESPMRKEELEYPTGIRFCLLAGVSILGAFLISLDQTIVGTAIPKISSELGGLSDVPWHSAAYFTTSGGLETSWGKIFKYLDIKWSLILSAGDNSAIA
ncbi:hypothetical protein F5Y14DRAFT_457221 [Nemania sp. NC0429]|nr:hypothetical protein F5Y14DRAFT_457221 [Nemania sp. NC0429]